MTAASIDSRISGYLLGWLQVSGLSLPADFGTIGSSLRSELGAQELQELDRLRIPTSRLVREVLEPLSRASLLRQTAAERLEITEFGLVVLDSRAEPTWIVRGRDAATRVHELSTVGAAAAR